MDGFNPKYRPISNSNPKIKFGLFIALYIYIRVLYTQYYYHSKGYEINNSIFLYLQLFISLLLSLYYGAFLFTPFANIRILNRNWDSNFFRKNYVTLSRNNDIVRNLIRKFKHQL